MTPVVTLVHYLTHKGYNVTIHDPEATKEGWEFELEYQKKVLPKGSVSFFGNDYMAAASQSSAIIICTEWDQFMQYDYKAIRKQMNSKKALLFDLRSYIDVARVIGAGFDKVFKLGNPMLDGQRPTL